MAEIWANILSGFKEIVSAPFRDLSILWLLIPIILFWFIIEIYFGRYKTEKLGWNTALGNGLTMFWVVIISLRTLFENNFELFSINKLIFVIFVALYSIFIISISFTHRLKGRIFFLFASPTVVYYLFGIAMLWVHDLLDITFWVVIDLIILYIMVLILEFILRRIIPSAPGSAGVDDIGLGDTGIGDTGFGNVGKGMGKI